MSTQQNQRPQSQSERKPPDRPFVRPEPQLVPKTATAIAARGVADPPDLLGINVINMGLMVLAALFMKRGVVGLVLYLALYLVPMLMFFRPHLHHPLPEVRALAMAGMVIPMMFMDFGLTQTFLSHNSGRVVLCSFWMCVAALMLNAIETSTPSSPATPSH